MVDVMGEKPKVHYWHVYVDNDGVSRQKLCELTAFQRQSMGGAAAQWNDLLGSFKSGVMTSVLPAGWVADWHENPKPQWIIPLSGRWYVETMDGKKTEMGAGEISFGEDQNCKKNPAGHVGHKSGTIGQEPCVLLLVQLEVSPTVAQPGRWV